MALNISPFRFDYDTRPAAHCSAATAGLGAGGHHRRRWPSSPTCLRSSARPSKARGGIGARRTTSGNSGDAGGAGALGQPGGPYAQGPRLPTIAGMEGTSPTTNTYAFLRKEEGFRSKPYLDVNAHRAGYGSDTTTIPQTGQVIPVTPDIRVTQGDGRGGPVPPDGRISRRGSAGSCPASMPCRRGQRRP